MCWGKLWRRSHVHFNTLWDPQFCISEQFPPPCLWTRLPLPPKSFIGVQGFIQHHVHTQQYQENLGKWEKLGRILTFTLNSRQSLLFSLGSGAHFVVVFYFAVKFEKREWKTSEIFLFLVLLKTTGRVQICNTKFNRLLLHKVKTPSLDILEIKNHMPGYSFMLSISFPLCPVGTVLVHCSTKINWSFILPKFFTSSYGAPPK